MAARGRIIELLEMKKYSGTTENNPELNSMLGQADRVILHAIVNDSSGTAPTLTVRAYDSADGENWAEVGSSPPIDGQSINSAPTTLRGVVDFPHGRFLKLAVEFGGTNPTATMALRASFKSA